ncbi:DUF917 domain-containing protein [Lentzea sp. NPDC059081]|uniref:DUF917 domain-containing protein n=1 Tax=Lentzea sp. NPDC059081 TaxID=3346719 RepID=UPI003683D971
MDVRPGTGAADGVRPAEIDSGHLDDLALGSAVLSSGGDAARAGFLHRALRESLGPGLAVPLVQAADLPPDAWVVHVGLLAAPFAAGEAMPVGTELARAARAVAHRRQVPVDAVATIEIGGHNAAAGVLAAVRLGVPLVDGDLMGRAFPRIDQTILSASGFPLTPVVLLDADGGQVTVETDDAGAVARIAAAVCATVGGWVAVATTPVRARDLAEHGINGSVTRAIGLGRTLSAAHPPADLVAELGGEVVFRGTVVDVVRTSSPSVAVLEGADNRWDVARIDMVGEFLVVAVNGEAVATTPDVICVVTESGELVGVETVRRGQAVHVVRLPSDPKWKSPETLRLSGPEAFQIAMDPVL